MKALRKEIKNMIVCDDNNHPIECVLVKVDLKSLEACIVCSGSKFECECELYKHNNINNYAFVIYDFPNIDEQLDINLSRKQK